MKIKNIRVLNRLFLVIALLIPTLFISASDIEAVEFCSDQYYVTQTLSNGAA